MIYEIDLALKKIKKNHPLILQITNLVTINDCVNVCTSLGASPLVSFCKEEFKEIIEKIDALYLNIGTMDFLMQDAIFEALEFANKFKKPVVLDVVGYHISSVRKNLVDKILNSFKIDILKGNSSELKAILGQDVNAIGIDSFERDEDFEDVVLKIAKKYNLVVALTSKIDFVSDGEKVYKIFNGCEKLKSVSGTGCMVGAIITTFAGVGLKNLFCAVAGLLLMGIASEKIKGNFRYELINSIASVNKKDLFFLSKVLQSGIDHKIYAITNGNVKNKSIFKYTKELLASGVKIIQYREKNKNFKQMLYEAYKLKIMCDKFNAIFIINDFLELAKKVNADGIHLGQDDEKLLTAREILGDHKIIGISALNEDEIKLGIKNGANYLGIGPVFKTDTKKDIKGYIDFKILEFIKNLDTQIFFIGGINSKNITKLPGGKNIGYSIISDLLNSKDISKKVEELNSIIKEMNS